MANLWLGVAFVPDARAQLATTEVMSAAATNCVTGWTGHPDFVEISNLGPTPIDLNGYRWWDSDPVPFSQANPLPNIILGLGESIVLVRSSRSVPDAAAFRAWWGEDRLPADLWIFFYEKPGFDGEGGDGVRVWDAQTNLVDQVSFPQAVLDKGITFVRDVNTGQFGVLSQLGAAGAFRAASCEDIGSPGFAGCGPVPMSITGQPASQTADAGGTVTFHVQAAGLPQPRGFQWYFGDTPIQGVQSGPDTIPVAISCAGCGLAWRSQPQPSDLVLSNVQPAQAGPYFVVFTNGLERMTSAVVTLTVNTNPIAPHIQCPASEWWFPPLNGRPQTNLVLSAWQTAIFEARVRAYPAPTFRWSWSADGKSFTDLPAATNRTLTVSYVQPSHAGTYRVRVQNKHGTNYAHATLTVEPPPNLKITEAMAYEFLGPNHDWWELTNPGQAPVNLTGFRWNDDPGNIGGGPTITNAIVIQPGESVILVESMTAESFARWWGPENLPPNLQIIVYGANGLTELGDEINLWNPYATDDLDYIDSVVFSTPTQGASFWFDLEACLESEFGMVSVAGECGAVQAANGGDVGSPGWTRWTPPCVTAVEYGGETVTVRWKAQPGSRNRLQFAEELATPPSATVWTDVGDYTFAGATGMALHADPSLSTATQRFYRVVNVSPAGCPCY